MTASGPFALGPANAGSSMRRSAPRSNFISNMPLASGSRSSLGGGLSNSAAPALKKELDFSEKGKAKQATDTAGDEGEVYSDPDDGVEIIDMEHIRDMDWMAPESLKKERQIKKRIKREAPGIYRYLIRMTNDIHLIMIKPRRRSIQLMPLILAKAKRRRNLRTLLRTLHPT